MLEDDLIAILRNRRVVLNNALEALHQYRNITSQVDNKHLALTCIVNSLCAYYFLDSSFLMFVLSSMLTI